MSKKHRKLLSTEEIELHLSNLVLLGRRLEAIGRGNPQNRQDTIADIAKSKLAILNLLEDAAPKQLGKPR